MGVNPKQLFIRTFGEDSEQDFLPMHMTLYVSKGFPLSINYETFKKIAQNNEVLVCPVKPQPYQNFKDGSSVFVPLNMDNIGVSVGFMKKDIHFIDRYSTTLNIEEKNIVSTLNMIDKKEQKREVLQSSHIPTVDDVYAFRDKQLKRFYNVTIARMPFNQSFKEVKEFLKIKCEYENFEG